MTAKEALLERVVRMDETEAGAALAALELAKAEESELPPLVADLRALSDRLPMEAFEGLPTPDEIDFVLYGTRPTQ
ncbi:MAG: hypothetical protein ACKVVT_13200 [Dehalococcoidia bacterium]